MEAMEVASFSPRLREDGRMGRRRRRRKRRRSACAQREKPIDREAVVLW